MYGNDPSLQYIMENWGRLNYWQRQIVFGIVMSEVRIYQVYGIPPCVMRGLPLWTRRILGVTACLLWHPVHALSWAWPGLTVGIWGDRLPWKPRDSLFECQESLDN